MLYFDALFFNSFDFSVVQNRITAYWFRDKELAMAFGITLCFSRLGSVLNFFLTESFEEDYGLKITLWGGKFQYAKLSFSLLLIDSEKLVACKIADVRRRLSGLSSQVC